MMLDASAIDGADLAESYAENTSEEELDGAGYQAPGAANESQQDKGTASDASEPRSLTIDVDLEDQNDKAKRVATQRSKNIEQCPFLDLRRRAFGLADSLARRFGMADLVVPLPDCGNGFLIVDVPSRSLLDSADSQSRAAIGTMWWQLLAFSEIAGAPPAMIEEQLPADSALRRILQDREVELLFDRVELIEAAYIAEQFWARLPKQDWQDWLYLAHTHRDIRAKVIEMEQPLWRQAR
jgi:hypothetical protein